MSNTSLPNVKQYPPFKSIKSIAQFPYKEESSTRNLFSKSKVELSSRQEANHGTSFQLFAKQNDLSHLKTQRSKFGAYHGDNSYDFDVNTYMTKKSSRLKKYPNTR